MVLDAFYMVAKRPFLCRNSCKPFSFSLSFHKFNASYYLYCLLSLQLFATCRSARWALEALRKIFSWNYDKWSLCWSLCWNFKIQAYFLKEIPRYVFGIVNGHTVPSICEECRVLWCIIAAGEILENNQTHIIVRVELLKSVMHKKSPRREYETRECV